MERLLVTGGRGFLGRQIVRASREAGFDVRSCSRTEGVDLRDGDAFGLFLKAVAPSTVIHCAAHVGGIGYVGEHAIEVFHDNLALAAGLLRGIHVAGVKRLITIMPNCTYPGDKSLYREDEWWDGPIHDSVLMYGLPRKVLWGLCKTYGDVGEVKSAHLILPNLYGPGDHFDPARSHALGALVKRIVDARSQGESRVTIWGSGKPIREWLYAEDAAAAVVRFLQVAGHEQAAWTNHPIYNVGVGKGISIAELAEMIRDAVGWNGELVFDMTKPDGAMSKRMDGARFSGLTGWSPNVTLRDGIARTIAWYQTLAAREPVHAH